MNRALRPQAASAPDEERSYLSLDHELRRHLFGYGTDTRSGLVKGEDARLTVACLLNQMRDLHDAAYCGRQYYSARLAGDENAADWLHTKPGAFPRAEDPGAGRTPLSESPSEESGGSG